MEAAAEDLTSTETLVVGAYERGVEPRWARRWGEPTLEIVEVEGRGSIVGGFLPRLAIPCPPP